MKRALDAVLAAPAAAAFVACVELFLMRSRRGRSRIDKVPVPAPARLRVRRGTDGARATFAIEGVLDEFSARLLACAVAQTPAGATVVFDLNLAGPIRDSPVGIVASACTAARRVHLRGLRRVRSEPGRADPGQPGRHRRERVHRGAAGPSARSAGRPRGARRATERAWSAGRRHRRRWMNP